MSTEARQDGAKRPGRTAPGAFGLAISSDAGLPGLETRTQTAGARTVEHRMVSAEDLRERCESGTLVRLGGDGEGALRLEYHQHSSGGILIRTESFGEHLIADSGQSVFSAVEGVDDDLWPRYVLGQVLPLTASVQGLEIFHASAVSVDGSVIALAGPSGAGKSALALALIDQGAAFFTDDVLALDAGAFDLTAFPGTTLMSIPHDQASNVRDSLLTGPPWKADERKAVVPVRGERAAQPIRSFVVLSPGERVEGVSFGACLPNSLMANTFDGVSRTPERMRRLLRVGAMLAADDRALELRYSKKTSPPEVAQALLDRLAVPAG